jgi:hypothetical protein
VFGRHFRDWLRRMLLLDQTEADSECYCKLSQD